MSAETQALLLHVGAWWLDFLVGFVLGAGWARWMSRPRASVRRQPIYRVVELPEERPCLEARRIEQVGTNHR